MDAGDILRIAETLQLFRFCELVSGDVQLTNNGMKFASGTIDQRKKIFRDHLQKYVPLAAHIRHILEERTDHTAPISLFLDEVENHIPTESAEEALKAVISWARYAEFFSYDEQAEKFTLEEP